MKLALLSNSRPSLEETLLCLEVP